MEQAPPPPANSGLRSFWRHLDGVAVINLDDRPDRWQETVQELSHFPEAPVPLRISAVRGVDLPGYGQRPWFHGRSSDKRWAGRGGCTQSHRKTMEMARVRGWRTFLVLEDDACLQPLRTLPLDQLEELLFVQHADWDVCYLGFGKAEDGALRLAAIADRHLCEVVGCYAAHAYLVRERARDWIFALLAADVQAWPWHAQHRIIDRWYARQLSQHHKVVALSPSVITQRASFSDIMQRQVEYAGEYAGRLVQVTVDRGQFVRQRRRQHWKFRWADRYDWLRAQLKRWTGF